MKLCLFHLDNSGPTTPLGWWQSASQRVVSPLCPSLCWIFTPLFPHSRLCLSHHEQLKLLTRQQCLSLCSCIHIIVSQSRLSWHGSLDLPSLVRCLTCWVDLGFFFVCVFFFIDWAQASGSFNFFSFPVPIYAQMSVQSQWNSWQRRQEELSVALVVLFEPYNKYTSL